MNSNDKRLIFRLGEESIPTVMTADELPASPFADVLHAAKERIAEITSLSKLVESNSEDFNWQDATPNNIIAFLGDRGAGKTSCMRTLVNILKNEQNESESDDWFFADEMDPSFFDEKHNVLEILIGALYGVFKNDCKDLSRKLLKERDALKSIQEHFIKVKSALRYISNVPELKNEYEIDALHHLNDGGRIRSLLKDLISNILAYKNKKCLVVTIDDLDLNIEQSYRMMEHIRKYLILPNVIVIIAAKYTQLFDSVCRDLTAVYKGMEYRVSHMDIAEMAERYLNKMFPLDQRFEMPSVDSYMDAELQIIDSDGNIKYEKEDVKLTVPSIIFEKTRFLFYNSSGMPSLVIPRNLRDLRMLVSMLVKMKPYSEETQAQNKRAFKDYFFNEWLGIVEPEFRAFTYALLEEENLAKINRFVIKNLYDLFLSKIETYESLREEFEKPFDPNARQTSLLRERELLRDILNPSNSYWNVSVGDVVYIVNTIRKSYDSPKVLTLLFFIETFYSMRLYETYDKLSAMTDNDGIKLPEEKNTSAPELKTSVRGDVPEYFRLVGGSFFAPTGDYFLPLPISAASKNSRERTLINGRLLMEAIRETELLYEDFLSRSDTSSGEKLQFPKLLSEYLRLCEFFMLTVKLREDTRSFGAYYRTANEPLYFKNFSRSVRYLVFDITMPFFNAICPQLAYSRFSKQLYEYAKRDRNSLLNRMIRHKSRRKENDTWELMSKAAIRNMEILEDLTAWLHANREEGKLSGANVMKILQNFYNQFLIADDTQKNPDQTIPKGKYGVKTYGKNSDGSRKSFYYIDYSIYAELARVIHELEDVNFDVKPMKSIPVADIANEISPSESNNVIEISINQDVNDTENDGDRKSRREELKLLFNGIFAYDTIFLPKEEFSYQEVRETLIPYCGQTIIDRTLGTDSNLTLSSDELCELLAKIRVEHRYDFFDALPENMQAVYNRYVTMIFQNQTRPLEISKANLESHSSALSAEAATLAEIYKKFGQEISQYEKDIFKIEDETLTIQAQATQTKGYLDYIRDRINENPDKTEYNKLRKEEEKNVKQYQALIAKLEESPMKLAVIQTRISSIRKKISDNEKRIDEIKQEKIKTDMNIKDIAAELDNIGYVQRNARKLEYSYFV